MSEKITITVDGRTIETENRTMLLDILNKHQIYVPQLCNHPSLPPSGACRLCLVEISKKEWNGRSKIVTSCLYPAEDGLIVNTRSEDVLKTRRSLLELYLAECPGSDEIRALARFEGIDDTSFPGVDSDNKCIMCGLCTRVCQDCGPGAISTLGRGIDKLIGPSPAGIADDCTGCRACAMICPTGAIPMSQDNQVLTIWNRNFEIPICSVEPELCRGCAVCEEVCPYSIPRVNLYRNGNSAAQISPTACVGCGICAGSCPTGAIKQKVTGNLSDYRENIFSKKLHGKTIVFSCPRSPMPDDDPNIIRVSCIGNVGIAVLLYAIAAGASGVALICRDRLSCPYKTGGDLGEKRLSVAKELIKMCGIDHNRLALLEPFPGQEGPVQIWNEYKDQIIAVPQSPDPFYQSEGKHAAGMDLALDIISRLKNHPDLKTKLPDEINECFDIQSADCTHFLVLEKLPELHYLLGLTMEQPVALEIIKDAAALLKSRKISASPVWTEKELIDNRPDKENIIYISDLFGRSGSPAVNPFSFTINTKERKELLDRHILADGSLACSGIDQYLQYALLLRAGTWQQSLIPKPSLCVKGEQEKQLSDKIVTERSFRIDKHPIMPPLPGKEIEFTFNGTHLTARDGEVITSALYASGISVFGHHHKDRSAQGIYCVNGQCSQCMVIADGKPVKGCMTPVIEGMKVESVEGMPILKDLPPEDAVVPDTSEFAVDVLIIGGGPAGISAAIELGSVGVDVLIIDDKQELGGKLSLQTHNFFGSVADCFAGHRGVHIGHLLAEKVSSLPTVKVWLNSTVVGVFSDSKFGISKNSTYRLVSAKKVLFSTGAREKSLAFPGADLPGVYGAGAFQTLVNRDLIKCAEKLFIIGGGNVGLIGAYHALQAGIDVVGLVEALPKCGGYKVHEDKIKRLGVPVWTSHTVLRIEGDQKAERIVIAKVDDNFKPLSGTERVFDVDTVLIAVGLSPVNELLIKAKEYGIETYAAGDAEEIAEASAAIFSGKILGRRIAQNIGIDLPIPSDWEKFGEILKHHGGSDKPFEPQENTASVYPIIRCMQEIPCNPCTEACPNNCIKMPGSILALPEFSGECLGCGQCVLECPGLAINLVFSDYDPKKEKSLLLLPFEFVNSIIPLGDEVTTTDIEGNIVGCGKVLAYKDSASQNSRRLLLLEVPYADRLKVAGFRIREPEEGKPLTADPTENSDPIVCRCERVRKSEIVQAIKDGVRDMNQLKAVVRAGLGGCNGKTCTDLILRIFKEEGISLSEITMPTHRPLVAEVHLGDFIAGDDEGRL